MTKHNFKSIQFNAFNVISIFNDTIKKIVKKVNDKDCYLNLPVFPKSIKLSVLNAVETIIHVDTVFFQLPQINNVQVFRSVSMACFIKTP